MSRPAGRWARVAGQLVMRLPYLVRLTELLVALLTALLAARYRATCDVPPPPPPAGK